MSMDMERDQLVRLNRILGMVIECNQALVRAKDEKELIENIQGILKKESFSSEITCEPKSELTTYKTHLVFPLVINKESFGCFQVYTDKQLSDIEYTVMKDLSDDIAYGISALRNRKALEISESRYKSLFENAPVALLEEDFSSVKEYIDKLKLLGLDINSLKEYLDNHTDEIMDCLNRIKILDVNRACLELYKAKNRDELLGSLDVIIGEESKEIGKKFIIALYKGETQIEGENINYTLDGTPLIVHTKSFVLPGYEDSLKRVIVSVIDITEQRNLEINLRESRKEIKNALEGMIKAFSRTIEIKDPYTAGHQLRVSKLSTRIAKRMNLKEEDIETVEDASLLHDIGKITVPAEILNKPARLTDVEFEIVKLHPQAGYEILSEIKYFSHIAEIILQHHERLDGSGYPKGLKDGEIVLPARIIGVADVVEAMLSHRPYRPRYNLEEVINELKKGKGILYEPEVVNICVEILKEGFSF
ncbi:MAG: HD domain-containing protein [bacterium]|nr:HD domain-containing protein [bacterium]